MVLKDAAKRVNDTIRKADLVSRLGGDEFVIIQPFVRTAKDSCTLAAKILEKFKTPVKLDGTDLNISLSIGISIYPDDAADKDALMNFADKAMYLSKQSGGNKYTLFSECEETV